MAFDRNDRRYRDNPASWYHVNYQRSMNRIFGTLLAMVFVTTYLALIWDSPDFWRVFFTHVLWIVGAVIVSIVALLLLSWVFDAMEELDNWFRGY